jgi:urea transport system substrate-binding protein
MKTIKGLALFVLLLALIFVTYLLYQHYVKAHLTKPAIKVGILHSLTGTMAISEKAVVDGELLAIDEINAHGGLLGRQIKPIIVDGKSDSQKFASLAEQLITQDKVSAIFGCWTSACRKTVKPIFEKYDHLLFYPVQYEGLEQSPNIIYLGAAPNQQIIPAVKWLIDHVGKTFFLIGSDYVFPRTANEIIKDQIKSFGGKIVGEDYLILGSNNNSVDKMVNDIRLAKPDVILNTINGRDNIQFFHALKNAGITAKTIPVMSFSIAEDELKSMNSTDMAGNFAAWNYFQSIPNQLNTDFVKKFKDKYGQNRVTDDPIETGYFGVYLWAQAVIDAQSDAVEDVKRTIKKQSFNAPEGIVYINPDNQHTWRTVRIGKIRKDGQFDIVWSSIKPIEPVPYPSSRNKKDWEQFLHDLYTKWQGNWVNPGTQNQ